MFIPKDRRHIPCPMQDTDDLDPLRRNTIEYEMVSNREAQHPIEDIAPISPDMGMVGKEQTGLVDQPKKLVGRRAIMRGHMMPKVNQVLFGKKRVNNPTH